MLNEKVEIRPDGTVMTTIMGTTEAADMLAAALRQYPELRKLSASGNIRIGRVYPFYMPSGDFESGVHVLNADQDQLDWLVKRHPEYNLDSSGKDARTIVR